MDKRIRLDARAYIKSMLWEWKYIFKDKPVFFSFVVTAILVSFLYTYLYSHEVLDKLPVGVIDRDNSAESRQLLRMMNAGSQIYISSSFSSENQANEAMQQQLIRGYIAIPSGFSHQLQRGEQPSVSVYADASYVMYYKPLMTAVKTSVGYFNSGVQIKQASAMGKLPSQARDESIAVSAKVVSLYNPSAGYATFLIPLVLVIIFQTTILTSVGLLGGTLREGKKLSKLYPESGRWLGTLPIVMGKATTYLILGLGILTFMLGIVMPFYGIPIRSNWLQVVLFMIPFLLSSVYLGIFLVGLFKQREDVIMLIMYTSIPAMLLTGFSWPEMAMPQWLQIMSYTVPSTLASKGFVALTQMGASLNDIRPIWIGMWGVCIGYLVLALLSMKRMFVVENP